MPHKEAGRERSQLEGTNCFMMGKEKEHRQHAHAWIDIKQTHEKMSNLAITIAEQMPPQLLRKKDTDGKDSRKRESSSRLRRNRKKSKALRRVKRMRHQSMNLEKGPNPDKDIPRLSRQQRYKKHKQDQSRSRTQSGNATCGECKNMVPDRSRDRTGTHKTRM